MFSVYKSFLEVVFWDIFWNLCKKNVEQINKLLHAEKIHFTGLSSKNVYLFYISA